MVCVPDIAVVPPVPYRSAARVIDDATPLGQIASRQRAARGRGPRVMEKAKLFVSYARHDEPQVRPLVAGLRQLGYGVWLDEALTGGQAWWDAILAQIRGCDAVLVAVSPAALDSVAVTREYEYAYAVRRSVVPVLVAAVHLERLPPRLASLQLVDCTTGAAGAFQLAGALVAMAEAPPLPDPLPQPPPIPLSYLSELSQRVLAPTLSLDEQLALVARLRGALSKPSERGSALELLQALRERPDLFLAAAQELERLAVDSPSVAAVPQAAQDGSTTEGYARGLSAGSRQDSPVSGLSWTVEVLAETSLRIKLRVTRRESHEVAYKYGAWDTAWLDGHVVGRAFSPGSFKFEFSIKDGPEAFPATITGSTSPLLGTIQIFQLEIADRVVYKFGI
jgi:hypothetical protein